MLNIHCKCSNRTKATIQQQREANNINVSLMKLWRCLQGMKRKSSDAATAANGGSAGSGASSSSSSATAGGDIIPFRESKLTHLLMPLLSRTGLEGVAMVVCVNPQPDDYDETLTILGKLPISALPLFVFVMLLLPVPAHSMNRTSSCRMCTNPNR
jgi:Kinesin motor domain